MVEKFSSSTFFVEPNLKKSAKRFFFCENVNGFISLVYVKYIHIRTPLKYLSDVKCNSLRVALFRDDYFGKL